MMETLETTGTRAAAAGFSLIEALIAAAILLIIALGLVPLFSRAITDNTTGNDATQATNGGRTRLEDLMQLPFNNTRLAILAGQTESQLIDSYALGDVKQTGDADEGWWAGSPTGKGTLVWKRTTKVRQYSVSDLAVDHMLTQPLDGGTQAIFVQLKEIEVQIDNPKKGILGNGQGITLHMVKPF
jgi:Tfp pilus assembly protein PilV